MKNNAKIWMLWRYVPNCAGSQDAGVFLVTSALVQGGVRDVSTAA